LRTRSEFLLSLRWQAVPDCLLESIACLALRAYGAGKTRAPAELDAYYIRCSDAELNWHA